MIDWYLIYEKLSKITYLFSSGGFTEEFGDSNSHVIEKIVVGQMIVRILDIGDAVLPAIELLIALISR